MDWPEADIHRLVEILDRNCGELTSSKDRDGLVSLKLVRTDACGCGALCSAHQMAHDKELLGRLWYGYRLREQWMAQEMHVS